MDFLLELLANALFEGVMTLLSELFNLGLRKGLKAQDHSRPFTDAVVGCAIGFALGIASVYFFPELAIRQTHWQWAYALCSPVLIALLLAYVKNSRAVEASLKAGRVFVFQATIVGLMFNLARLLFGK
jgi:hypothetical protein